MSTQLKLRRGTTAQHSTFTGAEGEVTVDTTKDTLVVHDGTTAGGKPVLTEVNPSYTGTLTGGTGVVNLGAGQVYKDASGKVGLGTSSPAEKLDVSGNIRLSGSDTYLKFINPGGYDFSIRANSGNNLEFYSPEYSANPLMAITNNGNVGIGTSSPNAFGDRTFEVSAGANSAAYILLTTNSNTIKGEVALDTGAMYISTKTSNPMVFRTNDAERARIDSSGNLLLSTARSSARGLLDVPQPGGSGSVPMAISRWGDAGAMVNFYSTNATTTLIGSISNSGNTNTAYNTSSDYRLKEDITPMTGALAKVALLKPCTYKWKINGSDGQGFIAHELAEVEAGCVTGEKDAVDAEGNPQYQGIDTSFLVATLTAAIQEQQTLITALTARIDILEQGGV